MACRDCFGRTPLATMVATVLCCLGVGLFCGTLHRALDITINQMMRDIFNIQFHWLQMIQILFIAIAITMGLFSVMLLVFGFLATGATRENIYSGAKCIMGGRVSAGVFIVLAYILNFIWMVLTSFCALPLIIYGMLTSICITEIEDIQNRIGDIYWKDNYCLNLSRFGIYINETVGLTKNAICETWELKDFCQAVKDAGPLYGLAFGGSLFIVLAMIISLIILSTNYQRIKTSKELTEYRDAVDIELEGSRGGFGSGTVVHNTKALGYSR